MGETTEFLTVLINVGIPVFSLFVVAGVMGGGLLVFARVGVPFGREVMEYIDYQQKDRERAEELHQQSVRVYEELTGSLKDKVSQLGKDLKDAVNLLQSERETREAAEAESTAKIAHLNQAMAGKDRQIEEMAKQLAEMELKLASQKDEFEKQLAAQDERHEQEIADLRKQLAAKDEQITKLTSDLEESENKRRNLQGRVTQLEKAAAPPKTEDKK